MYTIASIIKIFTSTLNTKNTNRGVMGFFFSRRTRFLIYYINKFTQFTNSFRLIFKDDSFYSFGGLLTKYLDIWFFFSITNVVPLVEQELLILPEHLSSSPVLLKFVLSDF